jgi:hypothetical protein
MDALQRSGFLEQLEGSVFLSQFEAIQALTIGLDSGRLAATGPAADEAGPCGLGESGAAADQPTLNRLDSV